MNNGANHSKKQEKLKKGLSRSEINEVGSAFKTHFLKKSIESEKTAPMGVINSETGPDWKPTLQEKHDELMSKVPTFIKSVNSRSDS